MWISRAIWGLFAAVLVIAPVCVASSAPLTKAKFFSTDPVSNLKRTLLRHFCGQNGSCRDGGAAASHH